MIGVKVKFEGLDSLERGLQKLRTTALPYACKEILNKAAYTTVDALKREVQQAFTLRNKYTLGSFRVERAHGSNIDQMQSIAGSIQPYMLTQEQGGDVRAKAHHVPIPAPTAAGQSSGVHRTKTVRGGRMLGAIRLVQPPAYAQTYGRRRFNVMSAAIALRKGSKFVMFKRPGGGEGIYLLTGTRKTFKARLLYDVSRSSVHIKPTPILERAVADVMPKMEGIVQAAIEQQLKRQSIGK